jgi:hypothetical protein
VLTSSVMLGMLGVRSGRTGRAARPFAAVAALCSLSLASAPSRAQTEDELASARRLFTEAVGDQEAKRYDSALEKFRRVASVRNTANVRYRIASCLDALGHLAEALGDYEQAARLGETDRSAVDAVRAASARAAQLDRLVPRLVLVLPPDAPPQTEIRVDDVTIDAASLRDALPLDPGHHTIAATAPGDAPFRTGVTLPEGSRVSISVTLVPEPGGASEPAPTGGATAEVPAPPPPPHPAGHGAPVGAWVAIGLGGALAAGSVVSFVLRASNLSTLDRDCAAAGSGLSCPQSRQDEVSSARNAAQVQGPLGIGLAASAVVATGLGVWLWATASGDVGVTPVVTRTGAALVLGGALGR